MSKVNKDILVSACIITYNQEDYIQKCLEGAINQKLESRYEIVIGVDHSDDQTLNICLDYQKKYPDLIRINNHTQRLGMFGNWAHSIQSCHGKYIAVCEGDDFWIDNNKLQKQLHFLENNPDCSMCYHPTKVVYIEGNKSNKIAGPQKHIHKEFYKFKIEEIISGQMGMWTASLFFRSSLFEKVPDWIKKVSFGDVALKLFFGNMGMIGYLGPKPMSVYNRNAKNAWSEGENKVRSWEEDRLRGHYEVLDYFNDYTNQKYSNLVQQQKDKMLRQYIMNVMKFCDRMEKQKIITEHKSKLLGINNKITLLIWVRYFFGEKVFNRLLNY